VDTVTFAATATVGGGLAAYLGAGDDAANLDGSIAGNLYLDAGVGNDAVSLTGEVLGNATILLGFGNDMLDVSGTVGQLGGTNAILRIEGGFGNDTVRLNAGADVRGQLKANLGAGNDVVELSDLATFVTATIDGSLNLAALPRDTFLGTKVRPGLTLKGFETF